MRPGSAALSEVLVVGGGCVCADIVVIVVRNRGWA